MKAKNLEILRAEGFPVPKFIVLSENEDLNLTFSEKDFFAVRSNFSAEDGGEHSFAGQFLTLLNVPKERIKDAVEEVFSSYAGCPEYKEKLCRDRTGQVKEKMCEDREEADQSSHGQVETLLIQEMLFPEKSGVLFTKNPKGILSEMVVVLGQGLGDKVVEDQENVITYHYFPGECLYREGNAQDAELTEEERKNLFSLGERIEKLFQKPMDIEFAIEKGEIYILQAREITTLDKKSAIRILDNSNISESFPGICLPLSVSFAKEMYSGIFTSLGRRFLGKKVSSYEKIFQNMVGEFSGRMYYEISSWYDILRLLPFSRKIIPVWQAMLGVSNEEISFTKEKPGFFLKCRIALLFCYYFFTSQRKMKKLDHFFKERYTTYLKKVEEEEEVKVLYQLFLEMKEDLLKEWDITLVNDMVSFISTKLYGKKTAFSLETMKPVRALSDLKKVARERGIESEDYLKEKEKYISLYGDRIEGELKLETRTYRTNEELLDRWILESLQAEEEERISRATKPSGAKLSEETKSLLYRLAESSCNNREISRLHRTRCFGLMRRIVDKIGEKTIGFDIYYLSLEELEEMLFTGKDFSLKIAKEKELRKAYEKLPVLSRVKLLGEVDRDPLAGEFFSAALGNNEERIFFGRGVSKGTLKGEVLKIKSLKEVSVTDAKGKILLSYSTDPGWFPYLAMAAGLITERGSLLSHSAILARELEKPAVVNIPNIMEELESGDMVEIDGDLGVCSLLKRKG